MPSPQTQQESPFLVDTPHALVAKAGQRNGYIELAPARYVEHYAELPTTLFEAARDWAARLERLGSPRVYWITLAEVVRHLHIHLYPRWETDSLQGIDLFQQRNEPGQPQWNGSTEAELADWAQAHQIHLIQPA